MTGMTLIVPRLEVASMFGKYFLVPALFAIAVLTAETSLQAKSSANETAKVPKESVRKAWPPEQLCGTIRMVDPARDLIVLRDSHGVPFDFVVGRSTRIEMGQERLTFSDLALRLNATVSVRFTPERRGDVARLIEVNQ